MQNGSPANTEPPNDIESKDNSRIAVAPKRAHQMTIDEPVSATIRQDLRTIYAKLRLFIFMPEKIAENQQLIASWDLWGPFLIYLLFAMFANKPAYFHIRRQGRIRIHYSAGR